MNNGYNNENEKINIGANENADTEVNEKAEKQQTAEIPAVNTDTAENNGTSVNHAAQPETEQSAPEQAQLRQPAQPYSQNTTQYPPYSSPNYTNSGSGGYSYNRQYTAQYAPGNAQQEQPYQNGYYSQYDRQQNVPAKKKKKSKAGLIAAVVASCIVLSALFGVGGALITNRVINGGDHVSEEAGAPNVSTSNNGIITDDSDKSAPTYTNPGVIFKTNEAIDNTGRYSNDPIVNAAAVAGVSVVEITTEVVQRNAFYGQYITEGAGSGVVITEDGYIITCAHVIEGASAVTVRLKDGSEHPATIIGEDSQTDIAVIRIEGVEGLVPATVANSDNLLVGQTAIAIGNPLGELGGSVSSGIISALDREIEIAGDKYNLLQTTAAINPGNSGGGLFNVNGDLIGIVNAKQAGSSIEGLGFSIPINHAIDIAEQLINHGYIQGRVRLGISVYEVTSSTNTYQLYSEIPQLLNYVTTYGVYFTAYDGNSGDLKFGDRIVAIDGVTITSYSDLRSLLTEYSIGDDVTITVARLTTNGRVSQSKMVDVSLTLIESVPASDTAAEAEE